MAHYYNNGPFGRYPSSSFSSVDWAQQSRLVPEAETETSLRNAIFNKKKNWTMDNVQKVNY
jgi:hypothetical protein